MAILQDNEVSAEVELDANTTLTFSKNSGLNKTRVAFSYTQENGKPVYGLIASEGKLDIYDMNGDVSSNL